MNVFLKEFKQNLKPFIFWMFGAVLLIFGGMGKYSGLEAGDSAAMMDILNAMPRAMLALFGASGVDVSTAEGYYAVIYFLNLILIIVYAISLGVNAISREEIDKTAEFFYSKPISRGKATLLKMLSAYVYLALFCILCSLVSIAAADIFVKDADISDLIVLFAIAMLLISTIFFALSMMFCAIFGKKGALYANGFFVASFILNLVYDMTENPEIVRPFTPMKYFVAEEIINKRSLAIPTLYQLLFAIIIIGSITVTFRAFLKRDLKI